MAKLKFMQVKITFDDKLKVIELAGAIVNAAFEQWPLSNCSLAAAPDQPCTSCVGG